VTDAERQLLLFVAAALGNPWNDVVSGVSWNGEQTPKQNINTPTINLPVVKRRFLHYDLCNTDQQSDPIAWKVPADMKAVVVKIYSRTGRLIDSYQLPNMFIDVQPEQTITLETK